MSGGRSRWAEQVRMKVKTGDNPTREPLSLRKLAVLTGYSYEHLRKAINGEPVASREFNDVICNALALDKDQMWRLAQIEKVTARLGSSLLAELPHDKRLLELWPKMTESDHSKIIRIAEGYVLSNEGLELRYKAS